MKRIREKLSKTRGASLIFALMVLLLCAFAGAAALTAAASNAGRYTHAEQDQQKYLSVASAMNLLCDKLEGPKLVFTLQRIETCDWSYNEGQLMEGKPEYDFSDIQMVWEGEEDFIKDFLPQEQLETSCKNLFINEFIPSDWQYNKDESNSFSTQSDDVSGTEVKSLIIKGESESELLDKNIEVVQAKISMDPDTNGISIVIGLVGEDAEKLIYETKMLLPMVTSSNSVSETRTTGNGNKGITTITTTLTVTVEWPSDGVITWRTWEGQ